MPLSIHLVRLIRLILLSHRNSAAVAWHTKNFTYRCPSCGEVFEVSTLENFLNPNGVNKKYLKCPNCGKRDWAEILRIKKEIILRE